MANMVQSDSLREDTLIDMSSYPDPMPHRQSTTKLISGRAEYGVYTGPSFIFSVG